MPLERGSRVPKYSQNQYHSLHWLLRYEIITKITDTIDYPHHHLKDYLTICPQSISHFGSQKSPSLNLYR